VTTANYSYDARGNLTSDGTRSFTYDVDNRLLTGSAPTAVTLAYDPAGRLQTSTASSATTTFLYDGANLAAEYNGGTVLRRYVPSGLGTDMPLVWYEGAAEATPRWLHADNQGSIVAWSDAGGDNDDIMGYDPWGLPDSANGWSGSRFRYTGQITIPQASLYYYKARVYDPGLGRFLQTDPVGYASDVNLYAYTRNSPVNGADPFGLDGDSDPPPPCSGCVSEVVVQGQSIPTSPGATFEVSAEVANLLEENPEIIQVTSPELVVTPRKTQQNNQGCPASTALANGLDTFATATSDTAGVVALGALIPQVAGGPLNPVADIVTGAGETLAGVLEVSSLATSIPAGIIHATNGNPIPLATTIITGGFGNISGVKQLAQPLVRSVINAGAGLIGEHLSGSGC
jgi:RHS repeat-associated protein